MDDKKVSLAGVDYLPLEADGKFIRDNTGKLIGDVLLSERAAFFVRVTNSHDELLEAVKSFDKYIRNNETGSHGECKLCKLIAKAEGK